MVLRCKASYISPPVVLTGIPPPALMAFGAMRPKVPTFLPLSSARFVMG